MNLDPEDVAARITPRTKAIMPVHLFGRHGAASTSSPSSGCRSSRTPRRRSAPRMSRPSASLSTFSFFPTKNLFGIGDGGLVAATDEALGRARPAAPLPRLARQGRLRAGRLQLAPRRDPGRRAARSSCPSSTGWNRARREAAARYAELGLGELCELPADDGRHVFHMYVVRTPGARPARRGPDRGRDLVRLVLRDADAPAAGDALPRLRPGSLPATEQASRENLAIPMWAGIDADMQERIVSVDARGAPRGARRDLAPDHPAPPLAARRRRRRWSRPPGTSPSGSASTRRSRRTTTRCSTRTIWIVVC